MALDVYIDEGNLLAALHERKQDLIEGDRRHRVRGKLACPRFGGEAVGRLDGGERVHGDAARNRDAERGGTVFVRNGLGDHLAIARRNARQMTRASRVGLK